MAMWGEKIYLPAIMGASGITREQAKTCLYYAVATYLLPDKIGRMPILAIIGPQGTGKSALLTQLYTITKEPKVIAAQSVPTLRDELHNTITAIIDEGDDVNEKYLIHRYDKGTSNITYKKSDRVGSWVTAESDIFGATIIARRVPFKDAATTSRSIPIKTLYNPGDYRIRYIRKAGDKLSDIASKVSLEEETSERIRNNWMPLQAIAKYLGDTKWLEYSNEEINKHTKILKGSQRLEPEHALLMVLRENMVKLVSGTSHAFTLDVKVSDVRKELKSEFNCYLNNKQIEEICLAWGFTVVSHSGYPKIKHNRKLMDRLCKERHL
jgi:hypothetical protein